MRRSMSKPLPLKAATVGLSENTEVARHPLFDDTGVWLGHSEGESLRGGGSGGHRAPAPVPRDE